MLVSIVRALRQLYGQNLVLYSLYMYLYMSLWLHESSHDSKAGVELSTGRVSGHSWYDGMVGTLPRGEAVGVRGVKGEISTSVLYRQCIKENLLV
jgi:hypothetical protein